MPPLPLVFIIAGEASGDQLGADLMATLRDERRALCRYRGPRYDCPRTEESFSHGRAIYHGYWRNITSSPSPLGSHEARLNPFKI